MTNTINDTTTVRIHQGENVRFFRDVILGWSQEYFATKMNIHQSDVSKLENQEVISADKLKQIAKAFGIDVNALQHHNLRNEATTHIYNIQGNYNKVEDGDYWNIDKYINPLDKVSELYERMLSQKDKEIEELKAKLK